VVDDSELKHIKLWGVVWYNKNMKNVLIIGVARAGKSTLGRLLKASLPEYNLIHTDPVKYAVAQNYAGLPANGNDAEADYNFKYGTVFQNFIADYVNAVLHTGDGVIIEGSQFLPDTIDKLIERDNLVAICLGHGEITNYEFLGNVKKYDTSGSWSYGKSDEFIQDRITTWMRLNDIYKDEFPKIGISYVDTNHGDRIQTLNNIKNKIVAEIRD
jgi:2-phosphoglycerate kinase